MTRVPVRTLCNFAARSGDLDHRYTPSPTSEDGIAGHRKVTATRQAGYQTEYPLQGECQGLLISGRADGVDPETPLVEEIKTFRGNLDRINPGKKALHRAQLRVYGALFCRASAIANITLRLTWFNIDNEQEIRRDETASADDLWRELEQLCLVYRLWADQETTHRHNRDRYLTNLVFPFPAFRKGQRSLSEAVYKTLYQGRAALIQAPTGSGKTIGTLYPALMNLPRRSVDRLFFLTVRNTGRQLALEALERLKSEQRDADALRVMVHSAREQACENPENACNGDSCPLARGFYDRLPAARQTAVTEKTILTPVKIREIALAHNICPYYLSQELAHWSDLVIADVNYYFDQQALLYALSRQENWKINILIDEAHNLVDRTRHMYSTALERAHLNQLKKNAPPSLKKTLASLNRAWGKLRSRHKDELASSASVFLDAIPTDLHGALLRLVAAITDYLAENPGDSHLQELLFEGIGFLNTAALFGDHSVCLLRESGRGKTSLAIHNQIPADLIRQRFESSAGSVLFSATLTPWEYHRDLLGMPADTLYHAVESPFSPEQLQVRLVASISTRLKDRAQSVAPVVTRIARQFQLLPSNYLVYVSSFNYLDELREGFKHLYPELPLRSQASGMSVEARQEFLDSFVEDGQQIGLAVLGGAFAEGIDLPGSRLTGVFILTLGLPPNSDEREILKNRLEARFGDGYRYTYLYPGIQKVVQAAGRVIRTPEDTGIIELIDDRFRSPDVLRLLPAWWPPATTNE